MTFKPVEFLTNKYIQVGAGLAIASSNVFAAFSLPAPVDTVSDGNYITMLEQGFAELADLLIGVFGILSMVIMGALFAWEFVQVNQGKKTWGNLTITMAVGGLTLVIIYILLSTAEGNNASGFSYVQDAVIERIA